jgi:uncharacterized protein YggU (UPF0235/DUF167 family)
MIALLRLKITPNAPANAVLGETDGVIRLKLQAPAAEGKANAALVAFFRAPALLLVEMPSEFLIQAL